MSAGLRQVEDRAMLHDAGGLRAPGGWGVVRSPARPPVLHRTDARPLNATVRRQREALAPQPAPEGWGGALRRWAKTPDAVAELRAALAATTALLGQVHASLGRDLDRFSARLSRLEADVQAMRSEQQRLKVFAAGRPTPLLSATDADHRLLGRLHELEQRQAAEQDRVRRLGQEVQALDVRRRTDLETLASTVEAQLAGQLAWVGVEVDGLEVRLDAELRAMKALRSDENAAERG